MARPQVVTVVCSLRSWGSGADLWGSESDNRFEKPRIDDGLLEVVGVTGVVHMVSWHPSNNRGNMHFLRLVYFLTNSALQMHNPKKYASMLRLYHRLFRYLLHHAEMVIDHKQNSWAASAVCEQSVQMSGV